MKICSHTIQTPGGCYETKIFNGEWYYEVLGDKIVRSSKNFPKEVVAELPARVKTLFSWPGASKQTFDLFLEDSRHVEIIADAETVIMMSAVNGPQQSIKWFDTVGSHIDVVGKDTYIGDRKVTVTKRKVTGFHFELRKNETIINDSNYVLSYTTPYTIEAVDKIVSGKKVKPSDLFPGIPKNVKDIHLKNTTLKISGKFVASVSFTPNGVIYRNLILSDSIVDVFVPAVDPFNVIVDDISKLPEEYIIDQEILPVVIDVEPDYIKKIAGGLLIKIDGYTVMLYENEAVIMKGETTRKIKDPVGNLSTFLKILPVI